MIIILHPLLLYFPLITISVYLWHPTKQINYEIRLSKDCFTTIYNYEGAVITVIWQGGRSNRWKTYLLKISNNSCRLICNKKIIYIYILLSISLRLTLTVKKLIFEWEKRIVRSSIEEIYNSSSKGWEENFKVVNGEKEKERKEKIRWRLKYEKTNRVRKRGSKDSAQRSDYNSFPRL